MKCEQIKSLLSPYVDGMTDNKEKQMVEAHIANCAECHKQLEDYLSLCGMMKNMDQFQVPDEFSADLHRRLLDEQNKIWGSYPLKTPKKSGWIAAGMAVIALTAGIYSSSFVPLGKYVTAWYDKGQTDPKKPVLSIDNIIKRFQAWNQENGENKEAELAQENDNEPNKNLKPKANSKTPVEQSGNLENESVESKVIVTTIKVNNMEESLAQIINIANRSGVKYTMMAADSSIQSSLPNAVARQVMLDVELSNAEQVLRELNNLGTPLTESEAVSHDSEANVNILSSSPQQDKESLQDQKADSEGSQTIEQDKDSLQEQKTDTEDSHTVEPDAKLIKPEAKLKPSNIEPVQPDAKHPSSDAQLLLKEDEDAKQPQDEEQKQLTEQSKRVTITINLIEEKEE